MFSFLRALGLQPIEWDQAIQLTGTGSPYIGEILNAALNDAQAIVVLMTLDEITYLRSEYANGKHPRKPTGDDVVVQEGQPRDQSVDAVIDDTQNLLIT